MVRLAVVDTPVVPAGGGLWVDVPMAVLYHLVPHLPAGEQRHVCITSRILRQHSISAGRQRATWVGGILTDSIGRRTDERFARTLIGLVSLSAAALLMSAGVWCAQAGLAAILMGCAAGVDLYLGAAWSSAIDIGGSSGGAVAGLMNAASNCAGFASPALMGWVLQSSGDWNFVLLVGVGTTAVSAVLWLFVNPRRSQSLTRAAGVAEP